MATSTTTSLALQTNGNESTTSSSLFLIRPMTSADIPSIIAIQSLVYPIYYLEDSVTFEKRFNFFPAGHRVAVTQTNEDEKVVGYSVAYPWLLHAARESAPSLGDAAAAISGIIAALAAPIEERCVFLHEVTIKASAQNQGLGKKLLRSCVQAASAEGVVRLVLCVAVLGKAPVWSKLGGFRVKKTLPWGYYLTGHSVSDGSSDSDLFTMREVSISEREVLQSWVCNAHVTASGYNEESRIAQINDLADDFPELYSEEKWIALKKPSAWVIEDRNGWVAVAGLKQSESKAGAEDLSYLFVAPEARRKGLGRTLLRTAKAVASTRTSTLRLLTLPNVYDAAIGLYESEGFLQYREDEMTPLGHFTLRWMEVQLGGGKSDGRDVSAFSQDLSAQVMEGEVAVILKD
jgi:ribosomal protein S18 acetylase RimI-like enzyme